MLDFLSNIVATTIEGTSLFVLTLNLFRFRARDYVVGITIANVIISVSNYLMEEYNFFYDYTMLLNFVVFVLILTFVFRIAVFESMIMSVFGFLAGLVLEAVVFIAYNLYKSVSLHEVRINDSQYVLEIISALLFLAVSWYLNKKHWWFTFVPFRWKFKIKVTKLNLAIITSLFATLVFLGLFIRYYNIVIITALLVTLLTSVLFLIIKKEKKRYDRKYVTKNSATN